MPQSRYDELHDHYKLIQTTRRGTRYERLTAVVFAALHETAIVIHDLRLRGTTEVAHQIDVTVEKDGASKRVLIECKDFDVSGEKVGLAIVRDFWGVVDDVRPDEAWILTCNAFTSDAQKYAKGKGIKLATLRQFASTDWEGRVKTIISNIRIATVHPEQIMLGLNLSDSDGVNFTNDMKDAYPDGNITISDRTQLNDGSAVRSISEIAEALAASRAVDDSSTELVEAQLTPNGWVSANGVARYPCKDYRITLPVSFVNSQLRIAAVEDAVKLLLAGPDGLDFVIWDNALQGYTIDANGTVSLAPEALQKQLFATVQHLNPGEAFPATFP